MSSPPKVAIVVDSAASLPPGFAGRPGIYVTPMTVTLDGTSYRDGIDISNTEFYRCLRSTSSPPTTSAPSTAAYVEVYNTAGRDRDAILCITAGDRFSASFDSATAAAEEMRAVMPSVAIRVVDSQTAAGSQALVALHAWREAQKGASLAQTTSAAMVVTERVRLLAFIETLRYLRRSGRVPLVAHLGASLIQIKPLFKLEQSEITTLARPRTRRAAIRRMIELMRSEADPGPLHVAIMHADAQQDADSIGGIVNDEFDCVELYISEFTPAMGAHIGPGLLGIAFWSESP